MPDGFDPLFDDREWRDDWLHLPLALIPPGVHPSGYRVERRVITQADIFGRAYRLTVPFVCCFLYDAQGGLWMSTTPQECVMMANNGERSRGRVLVGGLGLGLYLQYAALLGEIESFTVLERSPAVREIVEPTLSAVLDRPLDVRIGDAETSLTGPVIERYDTIFLDTWESLDAANLPHINRLRDHALRHLAPGGRVLLWGYGWMVSLFIEACAHLLAVPPGQREEWLAGQGAESPRAVDLLGPVVEQFAGQRVESLPAALDWCRTHITAVVG